MPNPAPLAGGIGYTRWLKRLLLLLLLLLLLWGCRPCNEPPAGEK